MSNDETRTNRDASFVGQQPNVPGQDARARQNRAFPGQAISERARAAYRSAGELLGCLDATLGFGECDLSFDKDKPAARLWWRFQAKGLAYMAHYHVSFDELASVRDVAGLAARIGEDWKAQGRRAAEKSENPA